MPASWAAPPSGAILKRTATRSGITLSTNKNRPTIIPTAAAAAWCCTPSPLPIASGPCRRRWPGRAAPPLTSCSSRQGASATPRSTPAVWPSTTTSPSSAATMRASTSGSSRPLPTRRSPSATTSSPAVSWPAWWWRTVSSGSSPACWPSKRATRRRATGTACWSTPSTPAPRSGRAGLCPRCCWAATTRKSTPGAASRAAPAPVCAAPSSTRSGARATPSPSCPSGSGTRICALSKPRSSTGPQPTFLHRGGRPSAGTAGRRRLWPGGPRSSSMTS